MAYVSSFMYCESLQSQQSPDGKLQPQLMTPLSALTPVAIPGNFSFAILCGIAGFDVDKDHTVKFDFVASDGKVTTITNVRMTVSDMTADGKNIKLAQIGVEIRNFIFMADGTYTTKVYFDGELIGEYKVPVGVSKPL